MVEVTVIIVNWNAQELLARCLEAVAATTQGLHVETIVVDNGSTDGSVAMVRRGFPAVRLVENRENRGFARANNQAMQIAAGEYLLLLNSDAFLHPGCMQELLEFMRTHPRAGAAGPRLYHEDGRLQRSCFSFPTLSTELWACLWLDRAFPSSKTFGRYRMSYWDMGDQRQVDAILGACMMLRSDAVSAVGTFDERFFMYSEEVDLCYRLLEAGWSVYYVPEAAATHLWGGATRQAPGEQTLLRLYRSRALFFRKHYGDVVARLYKGVIALQGLTRVAAGMAASALQLDETVTARAANYRALLRNLHTF